MDQIWSNCPWRITEHFNHYPEILWRGRYWTAAGPLWMHDNLEYCRAVAYPETRAQNHTFRHGHQNRIHRSLVVDGEIDSGRLELTIPRDLALGDLRYSHRTLTERMHAFLPVAQ